MRIRSFATREVSARCPTSNDWGLRVLRTYSVPHFFFAGYERSNVSDFTEVNALVPVETNPLFPLPQPNTALVAGSEVGLLFEELSTPETKNIINARADLNLSDTHNLHGEVRMYWGGNKRGFPGGTRLPESILVEGQNPQSISVSDNLVISKTIVNQVRAQFSRLLPRNRGTLDSVGIVIEDPRITAGAFSGSESSPAFSREETRTQLQDSVSMTSGSHHGSDSEATCNSSGQVLPICLRLAVSSLLMTWTPVLSMISSASCSASIPKAALPMTCWESLLGMRVSAQAQHHAFAWSEVRQRVDSR